MSIVARTVALAICMAAAIASDIAHAQQFPGRPIRLVVSGAPGDVNDKFARILAQQLRQEFRQEIVINYVPGAGAASHMVASAKPDGHTLLLGSTTTHTVPAIAGSVRYDLLHNCRDGRDEVGRGIAAADAGPRL